MAQFAGADSTPEMEAVSRRREFLMFVGGSARHSGLREARGKNAWANHDDSDIDHFG
jgi:hypothetical protein